MYDFQNNYNFEAGYNLIVNLKNNIICVTSLIWVLKQSLRKISLIYTNAIYWKCHVFCLVWFGFYFRLIQNTNLRGVLSRWNTGVLIVFKLFFDIIWQNCNMQKYRDQGFHLEIMMNNTY